MKRIIFLLVVMVVGISLAFGEDLTLPASGPGTQTASKIKVLVISGGNNKSHTRFYNLFKDAPDMAITEIAEGKLTDTTSVFDRVDLLTYDVVYLYDYYPKIAEEGKAKFLQLFEKGVGLMVVHDGLLSYQDWPEYERISGGTYLLSPRKYGDKQWPESSVGRNVHIDISVTDKDSPIAAGVGNFFIKDEIYRGIPYGADIHTVFSAEGKPLIWTREEKHSRVVACIIGHGPGTWNVLEFQKILSNAVHWVAKRG